MRTGIIIKTPAQIEIIRESGRKLARVKKRLKEAVKIGVDASQIDALAEKMIIEEGGESSFKTVPGYSWTTCVNVNAGIVHGIPKKEIVFAKGDIVSVDCGVLYNGFHSDTSFSVGLEVDSETEKFLDAGKNALKSAISKAVAGNRIFDISQAIEKTIKGGGYSPVTALVGHGVGQELHEEPQIPCYVSGKREDTPEIKVGMVLAIEVMYTKGNGKVKLDKDGWTIKAADDTISALYEDTVVITDSAPLVITEIS